MSDESKVAEMARYWERNRRGISGMDPVASALSKCADAIESLLAERDEALAKLALGKKLHPDSDGECLTCSDDRGPKAYPCPTKRALEGEDKSND